jgi:hypothetical protein
VTGSKGATIEVDGTALGFPGLGTEPIRVSLKKDEAGYKVLLA